MTQEVIFSYFPLLELFLWLLNYAHMIDWNGLSQIAWKVRKFGLIKDGVEFCKPKTELKKSDSF